MPRCYSLCQTRCQGVLDTKGLLEMNRIKKIVVAGVVAVIAVFGVASVSAGSSGGAVLADHGGCC